MSFGTAFSWSIHFVVVRKDTTQLDRLTAILCCSPRCTPRRPRPSKTGRCSAPTIRNCIARAVFQENNLGSWHAIGNAARLPPVDASIRRRSCTEFARRCRVRNSSVGSRRKGIADRWSVACARMRVGDIDASGRHLVRVALGHNFLRPCADG